MRMRSGLGLGLLLAVAVAPAAVAQVKAKGVIVVRALVPRADREITDTMGTPYPVPASPHDAFVALKQVYADIKIAADLVDSSSAMLLVGNQRLIARGDLGGKRMSLYLDCGSSLTGQYADDNRLDLTIVSFIRPADEGSGSVLKSVLAGSAVNVGEGRAPTQGCGSTGELEKRIHQMLLKKLRG